VRWEEAAQEVNWKDLYPRPGDDDDDATCTM
jgi:hypothetical protein